MDHVCPLQPKSAFWVTCATKSGKTHWTFQFLKEKDFLFGNDNKPTAVLYCYGIYQPLFDEMERDIENFTLLNGLPSIETIDEFTRDHSHKVII